MKNRFDYLKEKYQAWVPITKKTGNIYDPATNTIMRSNSEWDEYIKARPKAKTLKTSPLHFPDLCTKLFEGFTTTGNHGWSPSCTYSRPGVSSVTTTIDIDIDTSVICREFTVFLIHFTYKLCVSRAFLYGFLCVFIIFGRKDVQAQK
ncbi:hypothetical protein AABB24_010523 [Solanum stoloniferum]|uniref:Myb/SANT-like domain-containing protein n=1 Tax=Solanum stoloniferum TaxID=62892 RepID=A0ABD2UCZ7_9SOLN